MVSAAGSTGRVPCREMCSRTGCGRSSGGSGVIWSAGPAAGLPPSPVRSWPAASGSCPHHCLAGSQDIRSP